MTGGFRAQGAQDRLDHPDVALPLALPVLLLVRWLAAAGAGGAAGYRTRCLLAAPLRDNFGGLRVGFCVPDVEALLQRFTPFSLNNLKPKQAEATQ